MKRLFLSITLLTVFYSAHSQVCIPMWVDTGYGISPDTIINLPLGYATSSYSAIVQFKVPDSVFTDLYTGPINRIVLTNVDSLESIPASVPFYYQCNPPDCSFHADSLGCVRIQGIPTIPGIYDLTIRANVFVSNVFYYPFAFTGYRIVVNNPIGIAPISQMRFDVSQNLPNPVATKADIYVNLEHAGNLSVKISNLVGNEMFKQTIVGKKGFNRVSIDASRLAPGIYFYLVSDGEHSMTKRMVVDRK